MLHEINIEIIMLIFLSELANFIYVYVFYIIVIPEIGHPFIIFGTSWNDQKKF